MNKVGRVDTAHRKEEDLGRKENNITKVIRQCRGEVANALDE
jgi:hypothetical protein